MVEEINSINQILLNADAGGYMDEVYWDEFEILDEGEKAIVIRTWIRSVLGKIRHYQAEHQRVLDEAASRPCEE